MSATIETIRAGCVQLLSALSEEYYLARAGLKEGLDTSSIMARHAGLATLEHYQFVRDAVAQAEGYEHRRLRLLAEHLATLYEADRCRDLNDRLDQAESASTVEFEGETLPFRAVHGRLMNEPARDRRLALAERYEAAQATFEPLELDSFARVGEVDAELGFSDHIGRCQRLGGLPLEAIRPGLEQFLDDTEQRYRHALEPLLAQQEIDPETCHWSDFRWLFRLSSYDHCFPADGLLPLMQRWAGRLGLDLTAGGNVTIDTASRPNKHPRPFCSIIDAPHRVYLVLRPMGGQSDYAAFLHELGHAQHFGHIDPELPWEFRNLGDNSVTEAFAFLFDRLMLDAGWLREVAGIADPAPLVHLNATRELMMNRKYSAQLLYELKLQRADDPLAERSTYLAMLRSATGARPSKHAFLSSLDPEFYAMRYQQGWTLEAVLRQWLRGALGELWFTRREAGELLTGLWRHGQRDTAGELAAELGVPQLDPALLTERFKGLLPG